MTSTTTTTLVQRPTTTTSTTSTTTTTLYVGPSTTTTTIDPQLTTTTTTSTTIPPCSISINVVAQASETPEFDLISASLEYESVEDRYKLVLSYKVWMAQNLECGQARIQFVLYDENGNHMTTLEHVFDQELPNVWSKPVDTIVDTYYFNPQLFSLTVNNGNGDGQYKEFATINITADAAPEGQYFSHWTDPDNILSSTTITNPVATMKAKASVVTANYLSYYTLTVNNGTINAV